MKKSNLSAYYAKRKIKITPQEGEKIESKIINDVVIIHYNSAFPPNHRGLR